MNKKLILITLSAVMFSTVSFAQKVIGNVIDCSDMDSKFYSSKKIEPRTTTATNSTLPTNGHADISSQANNDKVYKKFEVYMWGDNNPKEGIDWLGAITLCATLNSDGTGWRLPTQRELMLMWILSEKLEASGVKSFTDRFYWSATHDPNLYARARSVNFQYGRSIVRDKTLNSKVRCVRDL